MKKSFKAAVVCAGALLVMAGCQYGSGKNNVDKKGGIKTQNGQSCYEAPELDANGDGVASPEEAKLYYTEEFKWFDQDEDGVITPDTFVSPPEVKAAIDVNKDGKITKDEYVNYWMAHPCLCKGVAE